MKLSKFIIGITSLLFEVPITWAIQRRIDFLSSEEIHWGDEIDKLSLLKGRCKNPVEESLIDSMIDKNTKGYRDIQFEISSLKGNKQENQVTDDMIEQAKTYPFENLIDLPVRGNVRCPFHEDRHPSASIKNNRLHCFTCNKTWDTIQFVIDSEGLTFLGAVKRLQL